MLLSRFLDQGCGFLLEVSDDRRDPLKGYSKKKRLGIFRCLDAQTFQLVVMYLVGCIPKKMFLVNR